MLIKKPKSVGSKHCNDSKAFIKSLNDMDDIYENIDERNLNKKCKTLIEFDDMIVDMLSNKKPNLIVTKSFIRERILKIFLAFITKSYLAVPKNIRQNSSYYLL